MARLTISITKEDIVRMSHRPFQLDDSGDSSSQDLLSITKNIGPLLDRATREVFLAHAQKLMTESVDYIIPAVWGAKKDGALDETQQEIRKKVNPLVQEIFEALNILHLTREQEFALGYLIREAIVSKTIFMIAMARNETLKVLCKTDHTAGFLRTIEPSGSA
jgi:hypothetical protein